MSLRKLFLVAAASRLWIFLVALIAPMFFALGPAYNYDMTSHTWLNSWAQYDAAAYLDIAEHGYNSDFMSSGNYQWWPLLPIVLGLSPIDPVLFGFIVCNIAFFVMLWYLYDLVKEAFDEQTALWGGVLLVLFPTSYFFSSVYSESLFLLFTVMAFYYAREQRWALASACGALSALGRIFGVFVFVPLAYMYLRSKGWHFRPFTAGKLDTRSLRMLLIPLAVLLFMGHLYTLTGNPLQFMDHSQTHRSLALPFEGVWDEVTHMLSSSLIFKGYHLFNIAIYLGFLCAAVYGIWHLPVSWAIYLGYCIIIPSVSTPLEAITRYVLIMFPAFALAGTKQDERWCRYLTYTWLFVSVGLLTFFTIWHVRGGIAF